MFLLQLRAAVILCGAGVLFCVDVFGLEGPRVQLVRVPDAKNIVKAQKGPDGAIHILYGGGEAPFYTRSTNNGASFSEAIPVIESKSIKPGLEFHAWDLAIGSDGRVHVAMGNNAWKLKLPQEEWGLYYATLGPGEKRFSSSRNLNRKPSEGFSLATNGKGDVTASFLSGKLYAMVSRDGGKTFGDWKELDPEWNPCDCCTTAATYGPDGRLALLYREETNNDRDIYVVIWDQAGKGSFVRRRISTAPWKLAGCPMTYFSITPTAHGYVAAWPTKGQIYFARLGPDGNVLPPGEIETPGRNGMRTGIVALSASDGSTLITWKNTERLGWQLYDRAGRPSKDAAGSVESPGAGAAGVALKDGRFLLFP